MRGDRAVGRAGQHVVRRRRLAAEDVEAGAGDDAAGEGVRERVLVHETAASGVDQDGGGLHRGEALGVDEAFGGGVQRAVERDDVGGAEEFVEGDESQAVLVASRRPGVDADTHAEGAGDAGDGAADGAVADDAERLAVEFGDGVVPVAEVGAAGPAAFVDPGAVRFDVVRVREDVGEDHLGDGGRAVGGDVAHGDAALARGVEVHGVHAGGEQADVAALGELGDHGGAQDGLVGDDDLGVAGAFDDEVRGRAVVERAVAQRLEFAPVHVAGVDAEGIENDDFHVVLPESRWRRISGGQLMRTGMPQAPVPDEVQPCVEPSRQRPFWTWRAPPSLWIRGV